MEAYTGFAQVYDEFMDNIPYEEWSRYLIGLLQENGVTDGLVCDLGCGTGKVTRALSKAGYDMIGLDCSAEMLSIAREDQSEEGILYLEQDMREMELFGTIAAAVSICDSMNYLLEKEDLIQVFSLVNNYLDENGLFIFDLNTEYKFREILSDHTFAENREDAAFVWDNYYYEDEGINEYDLNLFIQESPDLFRKYSEIHYQKAYSLDTIKDCLSHAGMVFVDAYDAFTKEPPREDSERIYVIAREGHQDGKHYE